MLDASVELAITTAVGVGRATVALEGSADGTGGVQPILAIVDAAEDELMLAVGEVAVLPRPAERAVELTAAEADSAAQATPAVVGASVALCPLPARSYQRGRGYTQLRHRGSRGFQADTASAP